jgi:hypothetical protein
VACAGLIAIAAAPVATAVDRARELRATPIRQDFFIRIAMPLPDVGGDAPAVKPMASDRTPLRQAAAPRWWSRERLDAWSVIAVPLWLLGVLVLSLRLAASWLLVERIRRAAIRPIPDVWRVRARELASRLGVPPGLRIVESDGHAPAVVGWLRPVMLLPASALIGLSPRSSRR